jgi:exonuclease SbcC
MQQKANALAAKHGDEAERITTRLETELRDATPETLAAAREDLAALEKQAEQLKAEREALELTRASAEALAKARLQERGARRQAEAAQEQLKQALVLRDEGQKLLAELDSRLQSLRQEVVAIAYSADAHLHLKGALPLARQRDALLARMEQLKKRLEDARPQVEALRDAKQAADDRLTQALRAASAAKDAYEEARRVNAAVLLRQGLGHGDPCPVCGQAVDQLPAETHLKLDELKAASDSAQEEAARTQDARNTADRQVALKQQEIENLDKNFEDAGAERRSVLAELAAVLPDPETPLDEMTRRLAEMDKAKSRIDALESDEKTLSAKREERAAAIAHAQQDVTRLEIEWQSHTGDAEKALKQAADAEATVREAAEARGWESVLAAIKQGAPAADVLRRDLQDSQTQEAATNQAIGAGRIRIERIEADIETAKAIRQEEREHREKAVLARDLATLLRADRFPAFIRDEAMKTLAAGGSEWLQKISQGRYDLIVEGQDFEVEDQWNAGSRRSVKTLSGGETFMASLSLALALAEQLPGLAGEGGASALESLFIDEGFSNLDTQTLDDVASALEVLGQDRRRLIGVITHVPALAERMPARITVHKSQTGSTVSVE